MIAPIEITQYGLSVAAGGWDGKGDSNTDKRLGNHNNRLNGCSCALSPEYAASLGAEHGDLLLIEFANGLRLVKSYDDSTARGLTNFRVDIFNAIEFDKVQDAAGMFAKSVTLFRQSRC